MIFGFLDIHSSGFVAVASASFKAMSQLGCPRPVRMACIHWFDIPMDFARPFRVRFFFMDLL
jgi:hypothetical protein